MYLFSSLQQKEYMECQQVKLFKQFNQKQLQQKYFIKGQPRTSTIDRIFTLSINQTSYNGKTDQMKFPLPKEKLHSTLKPQPYSTTRINSRKLKQQEALFEQKSEYDQFQDQKQKQKQQLTREQLDDGNETILLTVNPKDFHNFSGYYKDSTNRSTHICFNQSQSMANNTVIMKKGRKSSLFKHYIVNSGCKNSIFNPKKENSNSGYKSQYLSCNNSQQKGSFIIKKKHNQLMAKLKPLRQQSKVASLKEKLKHIIKPQIIVIQSGEHLRI